MNRTSIEWTDFSANPLKYHDAEGRTVWGCVHASGGCRNCYSEALAKRYARGGPFTATTMARLEPFLDEAELRRMLTARRIGGKDVAGSRCFVGDMTDVFGEWVPDAMLDRLFAVFALRPDVTWQVLTKRAAGMREFLSAPGRRSEIMVAAERIAFDAGTTGRCVLPPGCAWAGGEGDSAQPDSGPGDVRIPTFNWPLPNVWLGTSCEDQPNADRRIFDLLATPAALRFVSAEPLIGPIDFGMVPIDPKEPNFLLRGKRGIFNPLRGGGRLTATPWRINWVIVGGESGPRARACDVAWVRSIVEQCKAAGVACFVKQLGSNVPRSRCRDCADVGPWCPNDGGLPCRGLRAPKGADPAEWPLDLRVREFPGARA